MCPQCVARDLAQQNAAKLSAGEDYGKVSPEEYLRRVNEANTPSKLENTLREDWDIRTDDGGWFEVDYRCSCDCGFHFEYKYGEQIPVKYK